MSGILTCLRGGGRFTHQGRKGTSVRGRIRTTTPASRDSRSGTPGVVGPYWC